MSKRRLSLIFTVAMVVGLVSFGCNKKSTETDDKLPVWTTYNTSNSELATNFVNAIAIDASGNKWFGTATGGGIFGGVSKFDGTNWTTYDPSNSGLADNDVMAIAIDASDKWFATYGGGVSKFDGTNWTTYNTSNSGLASNEVLAIAIDASGNKWFGTQGGGVSKFHE